MPIPLPLLAIKQLFDAFWCAALLANHRARWLRANPHNFTTADTIFPIGQVTVGNFTYGALNLHFFGNASESVQIGSFCSIANDVHLIAGGEHPLSYPTTFPMAHYLGNSAEMGSAPKGPIVISDDVWIGRGATILSGVTIGQGAVIGAQSIVTRDIPPYSIYLGNKVVRSRFDESTISRLSQLDWSKVTRESATPALAELETVTREEFFQSKFYLAHRASPR
jgi:acetyltransferase-like isoleucine patch superfamily enzyme